MWPPPQAGYVTAIPWAAEVFIAGQELPNYSVPPGCSYVEAATAFVFSQPCKYFMAFLDLLKISSSHESTPLQTPGFRLLELFNFEVSKQSVKLCFSWLQFNTLLLLGVEQTLGCYLSLLRKSPTIFLAINRTISEFLGAVLIPADCRRQPDPFNPVKGLWHLQPVHLLLMYFSNSRSLSLSSWLFHLRLFHSLLNAFSQLILFSDHTLLPIPIRCYQYPGWKPAVSWDCSW